MAINDLFEQFIAWPLSRKLALFVVVALCAAIVAGVSIWTERVDYQVLYSGLTQEDAGQVIGKLKEMKVPYRVEGTAIMIPADKVYEARLDLATQGMPSGGSVGFEIFDKNQFGVTEFVQRLNYVRAIQGELGRTIRQLAAVDQARVHIAIPERSIFTEKDDKPRASVVLKLKGGRVLSQAQVAGVVHLVASSVEGLAPDSVTVVDTQGSLLSRPSEGDMVADAKQLEYQKSVDRDYESKLQSMLEGIIGRGKAIVRVSTKLDFAKIERTEEKFDPDTIAIRSEQRGQEKSTGAVSGGVPGVASNQPGQPPAATAGTGSSAQKQNEQINYEVSRVVSKISEPRGAVKNISVAVLVDGTLKKAQGQEKGAYTARTEQEMKKFDDLVKAAIGFDKNRGDQVIVENVPFETMAEDLTAAGAGGGFMDILKSALGYLKYLIPLGIFAVLFLFVIKPLMKTLSGPLTMRVREAGGPGGAPGMTGPYTAPIPQRTPEELAREQAISIVGANPKQAANVIKEWIQE